MQLAPAPLAISTQDARILRSPLLIRAIASSRLRSAKADNSLPSKLPLHERGIAAALKSRERRKSLNLEKPIRPCPVTTNIDYSRDEVEFANAMHAYTIRTGRKFPAYSEALAVLRTLGYGKVDGVDGN